MQVDAVRVDLYLGVASRRATWRGGVAIGMCVSPRVRWYEILRYAYANYCTDTFSMFTHGETHLSKVPFSR